MTVDDHFQLFEPHHLLYTIVSLALQVSEDLKISFLTRELPAIQHRQQRSVYSRLLPEKKRYSLSFVEQARTEPMNYGEGSDDGEQTVGEEEKNVRFRAKKLFPGIDAQQ